MMASCNKDEKASTKPAGVDQITHVDPALLKAIKIRDDSVQANIRSVFHGQPMDEDALLAMWNGLDPDAKKSMLKIWSYVTAMTMGLSEKEARKEADLSMDDKKIEATWSEFIEWQVGTYRKILKETHKEYTSPEFQEYLKGLPDNLLRSEGPYVINDRAYVLVFMNVEPSENVFSIMNTRRIRMFDEYRRQPNGSWQRVDWTTWNKITENTGLPHLSTPLDLPHVTDKDIEAIGPSFKDALDVWKNIIEHPEKIEPYDFIKHCDPTMLVNCKDWFVERVKYSKLNDYDRPAEHFFTWSSIYESDLPKITTKRFWLDYLRYCRDHMNGAFFEGAEQLADRNTQLLDKMFPDRKNYTPYELYLRRGYGSNCFISRLFNPLIIQVHDLIPVNKNEIYVTYRTKIEGGIFGGIAKEKFVRVDGLWKFQDSSIRDYFEFPAMDLRMRYEDKEREKAKSEASPENE